MLLKLVKKPNSSLRKRKTKANARIVGRYNERY